METINSLKAKSFLSHLIFGILVMMIAFFSSFISTTNGRVFLVNRFVLICFLFYSVAIFIFLLYAVPLLNKGLKRSSWRYIFLEEFSFYFNEEYLNICILPYYLLSSCFCCFCFVFAWIIFLICSFFGILFFGKYVNFEKFIENESWDNISFLTFHVKKRIIRPWQVYFFFLVLFFVFKFFDIFSKSQNLNNQWGIIGEYGVLLAVLVFLLYKMKIWQTIKKICQAIDQKICLLGKVRD